MSKKTDNPERGLYPPVRWSILRVNLKVSCNIVAGGTIMPKYDIFALCNACGDIHPTGIAIMLQSGPRQKQSVADAFAGKDLPADLAALKNNRVYCPKTGRGYAQTNYKQIFLVPIG